LSCCDFEFSTRTTEPSLCPFPLSFALCPCAYGKNGDLQEFINNSNILYIEPNKNKTDSWLEALRLQLPAGLINYDPISKITYYDDVVKSDDEKTAMQYAYEKALAKKQSQNTPDTQYMQQDRGTVLLSWRTVPLSLTLVFVCLLYYRIPEKHILKIINSVISLNLVNELLGNSYCFGR